MKCLSTFILLIWGLSLSAATPESLNQALNWNIFSETSLWENNVLYLSQRLGLRLAADGNTEPVRYSAYVSGRSCFGTPVNQIRVTESAGKIQQIDFVLFNKGDLPKGKKEREVKKELRLQQKKVQEAISNVLGTSSHGKLSVSGKPVMVEYWSSDDTTFVLDASSGEFLLLGLMPTALFFNGKSRSDAHRQVQQVDLKKNIVHDSNSDVYLDHIPMVDQGPKGYCGPASLERIFLYLGIEGVDMHRIAEGAKTKVGGGTTVPELERTAQKWGRRVGVSVNATQLNIRNVKRAVDNGFPLIWAMFSINSYMERARQNTVQRQGLDAPSWSKVLKKQKKLKRIEDQAHICLVIGYNETTKEIAVSNSWGGFGALWWISIDDAEAVSQGKLLYLKP